MLSTCRLYTHSMRVPLSLTLIIKHECMCCAHVSCLQTHHPSLKTAAGEVAKLQQHLDLLRDQYVKLQQKHAGLEQKYTRAIAVSGNASTDHFVSHLLKLVADLFDKPLYR